MSLQATFNRMWILINAYIFSIQIHASHKAALLIPIALKYMLTIHCYHCPKYKISCIYADNIQLHK
jgi:hypothetical protein